MIDIDKLEHGEWYDGFLWYDGRQKGVLTAIWNKEASAFCGYHHGEYPHVADHRAKREYTFEPNMKGVPPLLTRGVNVWCKKCGNHVGGDDDCVLNNRHCGHPNARFRFVSVAK